jgi:hypothetical protein
VAAGVQVDDVCVTVHLYFKGPHTGKSVDVLASVVVKGTQPLFVDEVNDGVGGF